MSEHMTPSRLAEIQARVDAATPGPWTVKKHNEEYGQGYGETTFYVDTIKGLIKIGMANANENYKRLSVDSDFIASARTDIPDLLSEVRRLNAELDAARTENADCVQSIKESLLPAAEEISRLTAQLAAETRRADAASQSLLEICGECDMHKDGCPSVCPNYMCHVQQWGVLRTAKDEPDGAESEPQSADDAT